MADRYGNHWYVPQCGYVFRQYPPIAAHCEYCRVEDERQSGRGRSGRHREHRRDLCRNNVRLQGGRNCINCASAQSGEVMCKKIFILIALFILALSSMAFPQAQPQKPSEEPLPVLAVPKDYRYTSRGRRDPFVNPIPKPVTPPAAAGRPPVAVPTCPQPQGLKGIMLSQAAIAGVVTARDPSMTIVIIRAPGGKTYFARVGDALCDAVVKRIKLDRVAFGLTVPPVAPNAPREIERKVRPTPGEQK